MQRNLVVQLQAIGAGLLIAWALQRAIFFFAGGPLSLGLALALIGLGLAGWGGWRPWRRWAVLPGLLLLFLFDPVLIGLGGVVGLDLLPWAGAGLLGLVAVLVGPALPMAGRQGWLLTTAGLALGLVVGHFLPDLLVAALVAGAAAPTLAAVAPPAPAPSTRPLPLVLPMAVLTGAAGLLWAQGRSMFDPTPFGFFALLLGAGLGVASQWGRWALVPGLALYGLVGWGIFGDPEQVLGYGYLAGAGLAGLLGLGAGWALAPMADRRSVPVALMAAALVPLLPLPLPTPGALATTRRTENEKLRFNELREQALTLHAGLSPVGPSTLRKGQGSRRYAELDGTFAEPSGRAGKAERFAGLLAGCTTLGRQRVRVGGDELGLVLLGVKDQGFATVDVAMPDRSFARALADDVSTVRRAWLDPRVNLLPVPAPVVLHAGAMADAVVEVLRSPWTDARNDAPNRERFAAIARRLNAGGSYVLAARTQDMSMDAFYALVHDFQAVWPSAVVWAPPGGLDVALLVGGGQTSGGPFAWEGFEKCAADRENMRVLGLDTAVDIASLAAANADALTKLPAGSAAMPGLPAMIRELPYLPLSVFAKTEVDPATVFSGTFPNEEIKAAGQRRLLFLQVVKDATQGDVESAFNQARSLARTPGGEQALGPLVQPQIDRAERALNQALAEGPTSRAWEEAEAALSSARMLWPDGAPVDCIEGRIALARNQINRAESAFESCVERDTENLQGLDGLAQVRRVRGNMSGAEEALRQAQRLRPDLWATAHNLGVFLMETQRYEEAERMLRQAAATQASAEPDRPNAAPDIALTRLYLNTQRYTLALAQIQRALMSERSAEVLFLRGAVRYELQQFAEAEADFRAALEVDPNYVMARGGLGMLQAQRGEYKLAAESFQTVLAREPGNVQAQENLRRLRPLLVEGEGTPQ